MNKEELVNLNIKDIILDKWKSKLSYPFNKKDLEELENIINYYEEENNQLKKQYCERIDCGGRLGSSKKVEELIKENEKLNHYKLLYQKVKERNTELEEDMKFILEQILGAFTQNWCIDWNFTDIREKHSISDKYEWNKGSNEEE